MKPFEDALLHVLKGSNLTRDAPGRQRPEGRSYSDSRRIFLRFRFRASACFARRLSPGFR